MSKCSEIFLVFLLLVSTLNPLWTESTCCVSSILYKLLVCFMSQDTVYFVECWWCLKNMSTRLSLGGIVYLWEWDPVRWLCWSHLLFLPGFMSNIFIRCWKGIDVPNYYCRIVYVSFHLYQFFFSVFWGSVVWGTHIRIILSSRWTEPFIISWCPSLSLVIFFILNSTLSYTATPFFINVCRIYLSPSFFLQVTGSHLLNSKWVFCKKPIVVLCLFLNHSAGLFF